MEKGAIYYHKDLNILVLLTLDPDLLNEGICKARFSENFPWQVYSMKEILNLDLELIGYL